MHLENTGEHFYGDYEQAFRDILTKFAHVGSKDEVAEAIELAEEFEPVDFEMPDGQYTTWRTELMLAPEVIF